MRELDINEIKEIQLNILDYLHNICVENHIDYYLSSGTLLGAIKFNGYIPWDDDIDVWIKEEDVDRLGELINSKNNQYHFCDAYKESDYPLSYCKLMRKDTVVKENAYSFKDYPLGINIDVFVLYKSDKAKIKKYKNKIHYYRYVYKFKALKSIQGESLLKNTVKLLLHSSMFLHSFNNNAKKLRGMVEKCKGKDVLFNGYENAVVEYEIEDFQRAILHMFENREYYIPCGYDRILRTRYGDYTQDLPDDKKVTHHSNTCYIKEERD